MKFIVHPGTGTFMAADECYLVDVPDTMPADEAEALLESWEPQDGHMSVGEAALA